MVTAHCQFQYIVSFSTLTWKSFIFRIPQHNPIETFCATLQYAKRHYTPLPLCICTSFQARVVSCYNILILSTSILISFRSWILPGFDTRILLNTLETFFRYKFVRLLCFYENSEVNFVSETCRVVRKLTSHVIQKQSMN